MSDGMVMRSIWLRPEDDTRLKELAWKKNVSRNDLIRAAVAAKIEEWATLDDDLFLRDLELSKQLR